MQNVQTTLTRLGKRRLTRIFQRFLWGFRLPAAVRFRLRGLKIRLQHVRQRMHVPQLAVLHAEKVRVGRAAAAAGSSHAKCTKYHYRTDRFIHNKPPVSDIYAARHGRADVFRSSPACICPAFNADAWLSPWHPIYVSINERVYICASSIQQVFARRASVGRNLAPVFQAHIFQLVVGVK